MTFSELPIDIQQELRAEREALHEKNINTAYEMLPYNGSGTRYFRARRCVKPWSDNKGHSMRFGGGTYWTVAYGAVQIVMERNPLGGMEYVLENGKRFSRAQNGTEIPDRLATKKEVTELIERIGIFN